MDASPPSDEAPGPQHVKEGRWCPQPIHLEPEAGEHIAPEYSVIFDGHGLEPVVVPPKELGMVGGRVRQPVLTDAALLVLRELRHPVASDAVRTNDLHHQVCGSVQA